MSFFSSLLFRGFEGMGCLACLFGMFFAAIYVSVFSLAR
jgi:hypothetical protein